uniref:Uncharacterized protein n=1 Tax=Peronospora matthiolae TaxID=2874970 RepID=A0AAV1UNC7_9STRA
MPGGSLDAGVPLYYETAMDGEEDGTPAPPGSGPLVPLPSGIDTCETGEVNDEVPELGLPIAASPTAGSAEKSESDGEMGPTAGRSEQENYFSAAARCVPE